MFLQRECVSCVWSTDSKCPHPGGEASWSLAHSHLERERGEEGGEKRERGGGREEGRGEEEGGEEGRGEEEGGEEGKKGGGRREEGGGEEGKKGGGSREGEKRGRGGGRGRRGEEGRREEQCSKAHEHLLVGRFLPECLTTIVTTDHQVY